MVEYEFPALETDDPAIQHELKRIEVIEDRENYLLVESYESESVPSLQTSLQPEEQPEYIDTDGFDYNIEPDITTPNDTDLWKISKHVIVKVLLLSLETNRKVELLKASAGYDLSLNANSMTLCYIDAIMELVWHCLLPRIDIALLHTKNMFDNMLKITFELTLGSRRRDASDRMRAFIFQNLTDFKEGTCTTLVNLPINISTNVRNISKIFSSSEDRALINVLMINMFAFWMRQHTPFQHLAMSLNRTRLL